LSASSRRAGSTSTAFFARLIGFASPSNARDSLAASIAALSSSVAASRSTRSASSLLSSASCRSRSRFSSSRSALSLSASSRRAGSTSTAFFARLIGFASPSNARDSLACAIAIRSSSDAASRSMRSFSSFSASLRSARICRRSSVVMTLGGSNPAVLDWSSAVLAKMAAMASMTRSCACPEIGWIGTYTRACSNSLGFSSLAFLIIEDIHLPTERLPSCLRV